MSVRLPDTPLSWSFHSSPFNISPNQLLREADLDFRSANKFTKKEFLHLRILYHQSGRDQLRKFNREMLPASTLRDVGELLSTNTSFKGLPSIVSPEKFSTWNRGDAAHTGSFAIGLELLHPVVQAEPKASAPDAPPPPEKIRTPRKTRPPSKLGFPKDLAESVARMNFNQKTPESVPRRGPVENFEDPFVEDTPTSTATSSESLLDEEMAKI
ncbi:hypothetical protein ACLMJK_007468 [Lecanora helva]